jgi:MarR-like DNA-binding transcriptional regulator SgrR of sgrS sRNA
MFSISPAERPFQNPIDEAWYDEWDKLESSEAIVPLLIHVSRVAVRKNIQDIRSRADGFPDFADCWIFQKP